MAINAGRAGYLSRTADAAPLAMFRILFGLLMLGGIIRFIAKGWVSTLYIEPSFFFSYYGFEWVKPLGDFTYLIFFVAALAAAGIALGYRFRLSALLFFLSFTYIELMDKTTYLNHYYFVSLVSFLLIFIPAGDYFSLDARRKGSTAGRVPQWAVDAIKLMLAIVYIYAGLAKLNSDWLLQANPLKIWLAPKYDVPFVGKYLAMPATAYIFSWFGALYDLAIPFLLLFSSTRLLGFAAVVVFHLATYFLFPIGMFPFIMIVSALIYFSPRWHRRQLSRIRSLFGTTAEPVHNTSRTPKATPYLLAGFFAVQLLFPLRYLYYPGELFWSEQGYRFSWRVMLMEKAGYAQFVVTDTVKGTSFYVNNSDFLTPFQEKQMAFQPDFILEYARHLHSFYQSQGITDPVITLESSVSLNGRPGRPIVSPDVNLAKISESFAPKTWITPFNDEIKGL